jgi:tetratricopeptide (TPR) repeat protein
MRKDIVFIIILLCLIFCRYSALGANSRDEREIRKLLAEAYVMAEDYESAEAEYRKILQDEPENTDARVALADILSWQREYKPSIAEYEKALAVEPGNLEIKRKLADVLSWDKQYRRSLDLYDEILSEKEDVRARLQKARVLGWTREYEASIREYEKILELTHNSRILLEKQAKVAYWNNRPPQAIGHYRALLEREPENVEARFDLSQIYSYQSMWDEAIGEYKRIIDIDPAHFRAKEGLRKAELISEHIATEAGYEFFEADSRGRVNDIRRHTLFNKLYFPVSHKLRLETNYNFTHRSFGDFGDVKENEGRLGFTYSERPDWWAGGFYGLAGYDRGIDIMHTFGGNVNLRVLDNNVSTFSFERERLENSSKIVRERYYRDNYKERLNFDLNRKLKLGADYLYSNYSHDNYKNEVGADILWYLLFEPTRFTVDYRYFYTDFDKTVGEYFSPRALSTHKIGIDWRHFLNKEELFFGADNLFYDLEYDLAVDSGGIASHRFGAGLGRDINKRLNLNIKGAVTDSSGDVYEDKIIVAGLRYYF